MDSTVTEGQLEHSYCSNNSVHMTNYNFSQSFVHASSSSYDNNTNNNHDFSLSPSTQLILSIVYTVTTFLSVLGNALVIVVFLVGRRSRTDLRWFLINLAGADLVMAVFCMPFTFTSTMLGTWIFSFSVCPWVLFMQSLSVTASVCTITAIGVDRFWVVYYPLRSRITKSRSRLVIGGIWLISSILSSVQIFVGRTKMTQQNPEKYECTELWPEPEDLYLRLYTIYLFCATYILPLIILSYTYGMVSRKLWTRTAPGNADKCRDFQQLQSKKKVIKMLVLVVTFFGVCWLPLHLFFFVLNFYRKAEDQWTIQEKMDYIAVYCCVHWLAMSNSFVNPIIYGFFNDSFRKDLKWLMCCCSPCASKSLNASRLIDNTSFKFQNQASVLINEETNNRTDIYRMSKKLSKKCKNSTKILRMKNDLEADVRDDDGGDRVKKEEVVNGSDGVLTEQNNLPGEVELEVL